MPNDERRALLIDPSGVTSITWMDHILRPITPTIDPFRAIMMQISA